MGTLFLFILQIGLVLSEIFIHSDKKLFDKSTDRPDWAEKVHYEYNDDNKKKITQKVWGAVIPIQTAGRGNPPKPQNGGPTGGTTGYEKGHIFGLFLGGTDHALNIVPQTAGWQGYGAWNMLERDIEDLAWRLSGWGTPATPSNIHSKKPPKRIVKLYIEINRWQGPGNKIPLEYDGRIQIIDPDHPSKIESSTTFKILQPLAPAQSLAVWAKDPKSFTLPRKRQRDDGYSVSVAIYVIKIITRCCLIYTEKEMHF